MFSYSILLKVVRQGDIKGKALNTTKLGKIVTPDTLVKVGRKGKGGL